MMITISDQKDLLSWELSSIEYILYNKICLKRSIVSFISKFSDIVSFYLISH